MLASLLAIVGGTWCLAGAATWQDRHDKAIADLKTAPDELHRLFCLPEAAKAAVEVGKTAEAAQLAQQALDLAPRFGNLGNGNAIHDGHMVLGRVALQRGDVDAATRELLAAGGTPGSPNLNSFGPNMSLARDLLLKKQVGAVLEYFQLCARFWKMENGRLTRWAELAKAGAIPDFGPNLVY